MARIRFRARSKDRMKFFFVLAILLVIVVMHFNLRAKYSLILETVTTSKLQEPLIFVGGHERSGKLDHVSVCCFLLTRS